jgi:hypothetical protein
MKKRFYILSVVLILLLVSNAALAQSPAPVQAGHTADGASVDAIVKALYDVISGPAGERDWNRFQSLFTPQASMGAVVTNKEGVSRYMRFTPKEYQERNGPQFAKAGFFEEELGRQQTKFGEMAHVWSAYQFRFAPNEPVQQRGINSIQLVYEGGRWWVANILWNAERPDVTIPAELVKKAK